MPKEEKTRLLTDRELRDIYNDLRPRRDPFWADVASAAVLIVTAIAVLALMTAAVTDPAWLAGVLK